MTANKQRFLLPLSLESNRTMFSPHRLIAAIALLVSSSFLLLTPSLQSADVPKLRAGIIGLDTSHVIAFTKMLNADNVAPDLAKCRVVAAYP